MNSFAVTGSKKTRASVPPAGGMMRPVEPRVDFAALYAEHAPFVRRVLMRRGVRDEDLDDVLQETFVIIHRMLPTFEGRASLETWLHSVAWRVAAGHHRRRKVAE